MPESVCVAEQTSTCRTASELIKTTLSERPSYMWLPANAVTIIALQIGNFRAAEVRNDDFLYSFTCR